MATITTGLLEPHLGLGEIDLVADLAHHLPIRVMGELLAVPPADYEVFADWTADLGLVFNPVLDDELRAQLEHTVLELGEYVRSLIAARRDDPGDDLLSHLIAAEEQGDRLTEDELVAMVQNLLFAGHDTTRSLLQIALAVLLDHPLELNRLRDDPTRAAAVVEEVLRYEPPVFGTARMASEPVHIGEVDVAAGETVAMCLPAANRDPRRYTDPHRFDPDRWLSSDRPPAPLSFGHRIHYCVGAALARMELQVSLPLILESLPDLRLVQPPAFMPFVSIRRYPALRATFVPTS